MGNRTAGPALKPVGCSALLAYVWQCDNDPYLERLGQPAGPTWDDLPDDTIRHWVHVAGASNRLLDQMVEVMRSNP